MRATIMIPPVLVFGWGNPARGDDALGPLFVARMAALALPQVECLTDYQLQVEHALDLAERATVLFVDASMDASPPFTISVVTPARDVGYFTSHTLTPGALVKLYSELHGRSPPSCHLLALRGVAFELGIGLSPSAQRHLDAACTWAGPFLAAAAHRAASTFF